ncbi:hypothetical protein ACIA5D_51015, partial [Actinoplanes sp. NPDC051513]
MIVVHDADSASLTRVRVKTWTSPSVSAGWPELPAARTSVLRPAGGMTIRDIGHHLQRTLGTELSHDTISKITDA